jgi:hypothetical protein
MKKYLENDSDLNWTVSHNSVPSRLSPEDAVRYVKQRKAVQRRIREAINAYGGSQNSPYRNIPIGYSVAA